MITQSKKLVFVLLLGSVAFFIIACNGHSIADDESALEPYNHQKIGDSLSTISQQTLLSNVARELKNGGPVNAIDFCNLNALNLTDSLSKQYNVKISRITSQPRNQSNLASDSELNILNAMIKSTSKDTVVNNQGDVVYYKSIKLGMSACLKCHGAPTDMDTKALEIIQARYPRDRATNYKMGDFRGAWKIQFED